MRQYHGEEAQKYLDSIYKKDMDTYVRSKTEACMDNKRALIKKMHDQMEWYSKLGANNVCKKVELYIKEYLEPSLEKIQEKAKA